MTIVKSLKAKNGYSHRIHRKMKKQWIFKKIPEGWPQEKILSTP